MVGSQIVNLIPDPSFGHNLCFKFPNGLYKPILDIYVPRVFQRYKKIFNPIFFDPCNCCLKIWESMGTLTPKMGTHLGVWGFIPSQSPTLLGAWDMMLELPSWPAPLQAFTLVASPRLRLGHTCFSDLLRICSRLWSCTKKVWRVSMWRWECSSSLSNLGSRWWPLSLVTRPNQPFFHGASSRIPSSHHLSHSRFSIVVIYPF
jgi:hypothetical protein